MPSKFITAWKAAGGEETPSMRELGAAYDNIMPLILVAGAAIGPLGLLFAQSMSSESDKKSPLGIARVSSANLFTPAVLPALIAACGQLSASFLSTFTPPTPAQALGAWKSAFTIATPSAEKLGIAMSIYLSSAFIGGTGNPKDAPPPPDLPEGAVSPSLRNGATTLFTYQDRISDPSLASLQMSFTSTLLPLRFVPSPFRAAREAAGLIKPVPDEILAYAWSFDDPAGPTNLGVSLEAISTKFTFPSTGSFNVTLTVCNVAGSISETRIVSPAL